VKVTGPLSTNHGEMAVQWARDGHGIVLRSLWDVAADLQAGSLVQLLPEWQQQANIWAVYPTRLERSAKVRVCVEFLQEFFSKQAPTGFRNAIKKKLLSIDIHEFQSLLNLKYMHSKRKQLLFLSLMPHGGSGRLPITLSARPSRRRTPGPYRPCRPAGP
jgi:hypothetical protein